MTYSITLYYSSNIRSWFRNWEPWTGPIFEKVMKPNDFPDIWITDAKGSLYVPSAV